MGNALVTVFGRIWQRQRGLGMVMHRDISAIAWGTQVPSGAALILSLLLLIRP